MEDRILGEDEKGAEDKKDECLKSDSRKILPIWRGIAKQDYAKLLAVRKEYAGEKEQKIGKEAGKE